MTSVGFTLVVLAASAYAILRPSLTGFFVAAAANTAAAWLIWQAL